MKPSEQSVLFRTCTGNDVKNSGGNLAITGLFPVKKTLIKTIKQIKYKAEVVQVITVGGVNTAWTPVGSTIYKIALWDRNRTVSGYSEQTKYYSYTTSADLSTEGATAALQREYINSAIVTAINADSSNHAIAASLGSGNGFTITDDGGYYPPKSQTQTNIKFVNEVEIISGYAESNQAVTTAGVTSSGVGAILAANAPVVDFMTGNLISGTLTAPPLTVQASGGAPGLPAVSGQNYDAFVIVSLSECPAHGEGNNKLCYINQIQTVWADNGTGSSTTNLTGFLAFERAMHKQMRYLYQFDANATFEFFDMPMVFQDPLGAAPTGTANTLGWQLSPYGSMNRTNIGTQTIFAPVLNATGLLIDQDDTATEGSHTSANQQTLGSQSFVVGQQAFSVNARVVMADWTDAAFMIGFRKKAVYDATINNYTDYATVGNGSSAAGTTWINGDLFVTRSAINGAATTQAISAVAPTDAVSVFLSLKVAINGTVTAFVNGTSYPIYSSGTTTTIFDAGDEMIAFYQIVNIGGGDPACSIGEFFAVADTELIA